MIDHTSSSGAASGDRPEPGTRFVAALIDGLVASLLGGIPVLGALIGAGYLVVRDGLQVGALKYRSVGKYVMGLNVVRLDGRAMDIEVSVQRNWMFGIGIVGAAVARVPFVGSILALAVSLAAVALVVYEVYNVYTDPSGRRWGDRLGNTRVVETGGGLL